MPGAPTPAGGQQVIRLTVQPPARGGHHELCAAAGGPRPAACGKSESRRPSPAVLLVLALMISVVGGCGRHHHHWGSGAPRPRRHTTSETSPRRADPSAGEARRPAGASREKATGNTASPGRGRFGGRGAGRQPTAACHPVARRLTGGRLNRTSRQARQQLGGTARSPVSERASTSSAAPRLPPVDGCPRHRGHRLGTEGRFCLVRFSAGTTPARRRCSCSSPERNRPGSIRSVFSKQAGQARNGLPAPPLDSARMSRSCLGDSPGHDDHERPRGSSPW